MTTSTQNTHFVAAERARRLAKLEALRARGIDPYPERFDRDATVGQVAGAHQAVEPGAGTGTVVQLAGRMRAMRDHGGLIFCDLRDHTGKLQLLVSREAVGDELFADIRSYDAGDWIGVAGEVVRSRTGELSLAVAGSQLLSKALLTVPNRPLTDTETRTRQRYLDLILNEDTRRIFEIRHKTLASLRRSLGGEDFTEVETAVLNSLNAGAAARPFETYHNALDRDMVMRIALELPLKRLIVGGLDRVFEIGRCFRNEGISGRHNPEFTMLEAYQAFADVHDMMDLTERLFVQAARDALGTSVVTIEDHEYDLAVPWRRVTMAAMIKEHSGHDMHPSMPLEQARAIALEVGAEWNPAFGSGAIMAEVFETVAEHHCVDPTMIYDYPREISPLAKAKPDDPDMVDRFELLVGRREVANAYSELNDPVDQRERFEAQAAAKDAGDEEAQDIDQDYVQALEYGLPPTGGLGIGVDRLVMLLAGVNQIRDVILFPTLRNTGDELTQRRRARARVGALPDATALAAPVPAPGGATAPPLVEARRTPLPHATAQRRVSWLVLVAAALAFIPLFPLTQLELGGASLGPDNRARAGIASVVIGLALLAVVRGLFRRKRRAWELAVLLLPLAAVLVFLRHPDILHPIICAVAVGLLWSYRSAWTAPADPRTSSTLVRFVPGFLLTVGVYGVAVLVLDHENVTPGLSVGGVLKTVYGGLLSFDGPYTYQTRFLDKFFTPSLLVLGVVGLGVILYLALRPQSAVDKVPQEERDRAYELVRRYGTDTLAYFALRPDKRYFFSADGEAMIAYAYVSGHALAAGDPIGAPGSVDQCLAEFMDFCRARAWRVAFLAVRDDALPMYRRFGLRGVYLGDEAIIPCQEFTLKGARMKSVRSAVGHVKREHRFEMIRASEATPAIVSRLNEISDLWRGENAERGFTMALSQDVEGVEEDFLLCLCRDRDDRVVAFLQLVPAYGEDPGYSLDLMRRDPDAVNGATEFLLAMSALRLGELGFSRLSMNFAPWARLFNDDAELGPFDRVQKEFAKALNPFFQISSLRTFNDKFEPRWLGRAMAFEDTGDLAKVGVLYAAAEGFVDVPIIGPLLIPKPT